MIQKHQEIIKVSSAVILLGALRVKLAMTFHSFTYFIYYYYLHIHTIFIYLFIFFLGGGSMCVCVCMVEGRRGKEMGRG